MERGLLTKFRSMVVGAAVVAVFFVVILLLQIERKTGGPSGERRSSVKTNIDSIERTNTAQFNDVGVAADMISEISLEFEAAMDERAVLFTDDAGVRPQSGKEMHTSKEWSQIATTSNLAIPLELNTDIAARNTTTHERISTELPSSLTQFALINAEEEEVIRRAVVKIECLDANGVQKRIGSGFVLPDRIVVTAGHIIARTPMDECAVIFPSNLHPIHYLRATIIGVSKSHTLLNQGGIDIALLRLPPIDAYPDASRIFSEYPAVPFPVCNDPMMRGDVFYHFGYPSNFEGNGYMVMRRGEGVGYADITGVTTQLSLDTRKSYPSPTLEFTDDEVLMHPYVVSEVGSYYGDSGGLVFNASDRCIVGVHRAATIRRADGNNYSLIMNMRWVLDQKLFE